MDTAGRLIAGSHNRNEFILINADETARVRLRILDASIMRRIGSFEGFSDLSVFVFRFNLGFLGNGQFGGSILHSCWEFLL